MMDQKLMLIFFKDKSHFKFSDSKKGVLGRYLSEVL